MRAAAASSHPIHGVPYLIYINLSSNELTLGSVRVRQRSENKDWRVVINCRKLPSWSYSFNKRKQISYFCVAE